MHESLIASALPFPPTLKVLQISRSCVGGSTIAIRNYYILLVVVNLPYKMCVVVGRLFASVPADSHTQSSYYNNTCVLAFVHIFSIPIYMLLALKLDSLLFKYVHHNRIFGVQLLLRCRQLFRGDQG